MKSGTSKVVELRSKSSGETRKVRHFFYQGMTRSEHRPHCCLQRFPAIEEFPTPKREGAIYQLLSRGGERCLASSEDCHCPGGSVGMETKIV
jgi:hypothetical protein